MNRMRELRRQLRSSVGKPVAYQIADGYGAAISGVLERVIRGERVSDAEVHEVLASDDDGPEPARIGITAGPTVVSGGAPGKAVALVPVHGIAMYDLEYQPYCFSTLLLAQTMNALANDPEIGTIVLDVASPGGQVVGTEEAGDAVFAARGKKNVIALVNPLAASAAYWIASQASQIIAIPSADIGSIGVFQMHADCSGMMAQAGVKPTFIFAKQSPFKVEGNPYEPLGSEAKDHYQGEVDEICADFLKAIARGRGKPVAEVAENFGKGRTMSALAAKKVGMIDAIATIDSALARIGVSTRPAMGRRRGEDEAPSPAAGPNGEAAPTNEPLADAEPRAVERERRERRERRLALLRA